MMARALLATTSLALAALGSCRAELQQAAADDGTIRPATSSFCAELKKALPESCSFDDSCLKIGCDISVLGTPLSVGIDIDPCNTPLASVHLVFAPLHVDFNHSLSRCEDDAIPIPGLKWTVDGVGIDAVAATHIGGDVSKLAIRIGIDGCLSVGAAGKLCGRDLTPRLPFELLRTTSINLTSACGATPVPAPKDCRSTGLQACGKCTTQAGKAWCWKNAHCYELFDPLNPCTDLECSSASPKSSCHCATCANATCSTPQNYTQGCETCTSVNHGVMGSNWCWKDLKCHDVGSALDPCHKDECVKNRSSKHAKCNCETCGDISCKH